MSVEAMLAQSSNPEALAWAIQLLRVSAEIQKPDPTQCYGPGYYPKSMTVKQTSDGCPYCLYREEGWERCWTYDYYPYTRESSIFQCVQCRLEWKMYYGFHGDSDKMCGPHPRSLIVPGKTEFLHSLGVLAAGSISPGCFVCGGEPDHRACLGAIPESRSAGERIVAFFQEGGAWLETVPHRLVEGPDWASCLVKVGACSAHAYQLKKLHERLWSERCIVSEKIIHDVRRWFV